MVGDAGICCDRLVGQAVAMHSVRVVRNTLKVRLRYAQGVTLGHNLRQAKIKSDILASIWLACGRAVDMSCAKCLKNAQAIPIYLLARRATVHA